MELEHVLASAVLVLCNPEDKNDSPVFASLINSVLQKIWNVEFIQRMKKPTDYSRVAKGVFAAEVANLAKEAPKYPDIDSNIQQQLNLVDAFYKYRPVKH